MEENLNKQKVGLDVKTHEEEIINTIKSKVAGSARTNIKPTTEYKAINGLTILVNDRIEFKNWQDRRRDAFDSGEGRLCGIERFS